MKKNAVLKSLLILYVIFAYGCSSLSKTQIRMCNKYFNELDAYYKYANEITAHVANVKYNRKKLIAASNDSDMVIMTILDSAITNYEYDISMPAGLRRSLLDINMYSVGYSFKSSYNTDFLRSFKKFLVDYIPFGIGNIIYELVYSTRKIIIKPNVGRKIKKHVIQGNEQVVSATPVLIEYYKKYVSELEQEEAHIKDTYLIFMKKLRNNPDSWERYTMFNPVFIDNFSEMYYTKQMINNLISATKCLDSAQIDLSELTRKRKRIKKQSEKLSDFYVEIAGIRKSKSLLDRDK